MFSRNHKEWQKENTEQGIKRTSKLMKSIFLVLQKNCKNLTTNLFIFCQSSVLFKGIILNFKIL